MLLAMDIGNTCITIGFFDGDKISATGRLSTDRNRTGDQYAIELKSLLGLNNLEPSGFEGAIISSVVPELNSPINTAVKRVLGIEALNVGPGIKTGLNIKLDDPAQLGSDLVVGAVAALSRYTMPCIILDMGTANTISVLNQKGDFLGGIITAGMGISLDALASRTSQLPYISLDNPDRVIGHNTISSMKSGLVYGTAAMMDGLIERIEEELGGQASLVATGGRAPQIVKYCKRSITLDPDLLLWGMKIIFDKNR